MMIRNCPSCQTQRPLSELFCEGVLPDGRLCGWDLSHFEIRPAGEPAPGAVACSSEAAASAQAESRQAAPAERRCTQGHVVSPDDLMCLECGSEVADEAATVAPGGLVPAAAAPQDLGAQVEEPVRIAGWGLVRPLSVQGHVRQRYVAERLQDGRQAVLTLYCRGAEPDPAVYEALRRLSLDHVPEILETGHWQGQAYEVAEELTGGTLADVGLVPGDMPTVRRIVDEIGRALSAFAEIGIRHRDLRPGTILVRSDEPLDLVITGFGSARLSELDLDIVSPLETTRYMAPEAIMGGVSAASDWWSLGMLLLELVTRGECFADVTESLFMIHVVSNGAPIPAGLDPSVDILLRGLLARDRGRRWQWKEVKAWLDGEPAPAPERSAETGDASGPPITLDGREFRSPRAFALEASRAGNWDAAVALLARGALATWAEDAGLGAREMASLRQLAHLVEVGDDFRLAIALKLLNPALPLICREVILNPGWLLEHPAEGYELISGPIPELLNRLGFDSEGWLLRLARRAETVRSRAAALEIEMDEETLRVYLLSTSRARLAALWDQRRRLLPDTEHAGLASILERKQLAEEDLVVLVAALPGQFRARDEILTEAGALSLTVAVALDAEAAVQTLALPRRDLYAQVDARIEGFARCGHERLDAWADQFRLERRMPMEKALVVLAVPQERWQKPAHQDYVAKLLGFFEKKVAGAILRGPLVRMTIGKTTPRIDLTRLGSDVAGAAALLEHILARTDRQAHLDPEVFGAVDSPEWRLRNLVARTTVFQRDTGINGLYLGFPFLLRRDRPGNTRPRLAPALLWPVRITAEVGGRGRISLAFDRDREEVRLNPAFEGLLGIETAARWREVADELKGRGGIRIADVIDALGVLAAPQGRVLGPLPGREAEAALGKDELVCSAVLFHVEFLGQAIVEDLRQLKATPPAGSALETMLRVSAEPPEAAPPAGLQMSEVERFLMASSDPSQEEAVAQAGLAPGLLVQGPPGTGKSQTIVNLVSDSIGRGRSVLICCQKLPALEVVCKRLVAEGLGERIIMVTDVHKDRERVLRAIRDQLETLARRDGRQGTLNALRRREVAGQIATLEADLDLHHAALDSLDELSGNTYRGILGELLDLEAEGGPCLEVPALRRQLGTVGREDVANLEETCGSHARLWLPACYEDSPLSVILDFAADAETIEEFCTGFEGFSAVETDRLRILSEAPGDFEIDRAEPLETWLRDNSASFRKASLATLRDLSQWLPLFDPQSGAASHADVYATTLEKLSRDFWKADQGAHDPDLFKIVAPMSPADLAEWMRLAETASKPASFLGRLNPARIIARHKVRGFLAGHGETRDDERMGALLAMCRLEGYLRSVRKEFRPVAQALGVEGADAAKHPLAVVTSQVDKAKRDLGDVAQLVASIQACPRPAEIRAAALAGTAESFSAAFMSFENAIARCHARVRSLAALAGLEGLLVPDWLASCRARIEAGAGTGDKTEPILRLKDTIAAYLVFRNRAKTLTDRALRTFAALAGRRPALQELSLDRLGLEIRRTIRREALLGWKNRLETAEPMLGAGHLELQEKVGRLATLDQQMRLLNREHLASAVDLQRLAPQTRWQDITRLRGARAIRLREFVSKGADLGLMALRPVWLMNPDVASRLLPLSRSLFDTVVYDEASQMPVEFSLPTLYRARIAVVSGDEKQMPPASFFASKVESDEAEIFDGEGPDEDATEQERDEYEETWNRREIKDCPDLLHLAAAALPVSTLQIHYRSAYRELIAFSNAAFYRDELSVPVRHPDAEVRKTRPIDYVWVNGVYRDQTNEAEAERVVDYLAELWRAPYGERPSVGVVTFNRKQADLIEEVLEERAEADPAFRQAYAQELERVDNGESMAVFVKNVENVQGDERDYIVFSTTFGRNSQGAFRRNFGVLGQKGGERRLNVAVTRARKKVVIMTSMPVGDISDMLATRREPSGPRDYLQAYLEYARLVSADDLAGARSLAARFVGPVASLNGNGTGHAGLTRSVEQFVRSLGHEPVAAGNDPVLGLDLAIVDSRTGLFGLGIECEVPRHRLLARARAREIWRPAVLARAYPAVYRVSAHAWYHDGDAERKRLAEAIRRALGQIAVQEAP